MQSTVDRGESAGRVHWHDGRCPSCDTTPSTNHPELTAEIGVSSDSDRRQFILDAWTCLDFCEHAKARRVCLLCHASACCVHGKRRWRCLECGSPREGKQEVILMLCSFTNQVLAQHVLFRYWARLTPCLKQTSLFHQRAASSLCRCQG